MPVPAATGSQAQRTGPHATSGVRGTGAGAEIAGHGLPPEPAELVEALSRKAFIATPFSNCERHVRRTRLIADFEVAGDAPPRSVN
ncbi:MAG TPA: hypothetical protein VE673_15530 [Pseudonocardiaceae bacterium]|nr:hypothetical protein [Pseudonocardiaceae bacterium]